MLVPAGMPPDYLSRPSFVPVSRLTESQLAMYRANENMKNGKEMQKSPPVEKVGCFVEAMNYDPATHKGKIVVQIGDGGYALARKFARQMVEEIACDHNVALVAGEVPQKAVFLIGVERLVNGNMLEMEFEAN